VASATAKNFATCWLCAEMTSSSSATNISNTRRTKTFKIAWPRFYRKAIEGAVKQINGANNWITRFPDKIFTDSACTQKLPIDLPPMETRRTHGVVVATGAHHAIQEHMNDDSGSFMIMPSLKGQEAIDFSQEGFMPFCVGDVNPDGMFVHVFDDVGVRRVLEHLNTITDFTRYLNKRAEYLRSGKLFLCHGEEELLANYLNVVIRTGGDYDFELPRKKGDENSGLVTLQGLPTCFQRVTSLKPSPTISPTLGIGSPICRARSRPTRYVIQLRPG
jgi:hypothetical protein